MCLHDGSGTLGFTKIVALCLAPLCFICAVEVVSMACDARQILLGHFGKYVLDELITLYAVPVSISLREVVVFFIYAILLAETSQFLIGVISDHLLHLGVILRA